MIKSKRNLPKLLQTPNEMEQGELFYPEVVQNSKSPEYEYAVLVTNLRDSIIAVSQLYRDRGDCENIFDELKNQWGWEGFTTHDVKRTSLMALSSALSITGGIYSAVLQFLRNTWKRPMPKAISAF